MISIFFAGIAIAVFAWLVRVRRAAAVVAVFLLFSLMTRVIALLYVDLAGPIYSDQLESLVGGGPSMPLFAASVLAFLLPLGWYFRPRAVHITLRSITGRHLYNPLTALNVAFVMLVAFVIATYADMLVRGPIPLFVGMDRLEYNNGIAGSLHGILNDNGFLLAMLLGLVFAYPRICGQDFRPGAFALYVIIMVYFALTGNRFSAFYAFTSFFVIPLAAVGLLHWKGRLPPPPLRRSQTIAFIVSPAARALGLTLGASALVLLLLNSVISVRAYDDPAELFFQRTLVQPVELWWATWTDMQYYNASSFDTAWYELFINPLDASRNTSVRLLMINSLGYDRALELADAGTQFAGGYPEILFELFGPWRALPVALVFGALTALLYRLIVISTCAGRLATAVLATYVLYGFTLLYIGGMLNFLITWTYWVKCGTLLVAYLLERQHGTTQNAPIPATTWIGSGQSTPYREA